VTSDGDGYDEISGVFDDQLGTRAFIVIDVERIADSCRYGVPRLDFVGYRENLDHWADAKGAEGLVTYRIEKNETSIDGLPALS